MIANVTTLGEDQIEAWVGAYEDMQDKVRRGGRATGARGAQRAERGSGEGVGAGIKRQRCDKRPEPPHHRLPPSPLVRLFPLALV